MKLESKEQAKAFLIFLSMEKLRHEDDLKAIHNSRVSILRQFSFTGAEISEIDAKAEDKWADID